MAVNRSTLAQALGQQGQQISQMALDPSNFGGGRAGNIGLAAQLATAGIGAFTQYRAQKELQEQELASQQAFAQKFPHLADIAPTLSPETRQAYTVEVLKNSLKSAEPMSPMGKLAADYKSGLIDKATYRSAVRKESTFAPDAAASGGATGALIRQYMKETGADYKTAFGAVKGLTTQGVTYDANGNIVPIAGYAEAKGGIEAQKTAGKAKGEAIASLSSQESKIPELETTVKELSALGKKATYTKAGELRDAALRQAGLPMSEAGNARAEYISKVDNQILPLLRDTFGAQFTEREGQTLRNTLGDPTKSPSEKDAVLNSFIKQKKATIESTRRQLGQEPQQSIKSSGGFKILNIRDK